MAPSRRESGLTGIPALQLRYWTALNQLLLRSGFLNEPHKARGRNWIDYYIDSPRSRADCYLTAAMNTNRNKAHIAAVLRILDPISKIDFERLQDERDAIEAEMGQQLLWLRKGDTKQSHIGLQNFDYDPIDEKTWPQQHAWLDATLHALNRVFGPRL